MAELHGKKTGYSKGKGGSLHLFNLADGFIGTCGIVAGGLPLATGAALALKMNKKDDIVVGYIGDGSSTEGAFHEVLNMAAIWKLPILFVCENNGYSEFSPYHEISPLNNVSELAAAYKIPTKIVDGNNVLEVLDASSELIENIRQGNGPAFLEAMTYRWRGHYEGEDFALGDRRYRSDEEIETWKKRDPIKLFKNHLFENKIASDDILKPVETEIHKAIEEALTFAQESPLPEVEEAFTDILG
jgi:pyruvate dehydrogenase E1 component alpha subunit